MHYLADLQVAQMILQVGVPEGIVKSAPATRARILPSCPELDRRGRALHRERVAAVAALTACLLAIVSLNATPDDGDQVVERVTPPSGNTGAPQPRDAPD